MTVSKLSSMWTRPSRWRKFRPCRRESTSFGKNDCMMTVLLSEYTRAETRSPLKMKAVIFSVVISGCPLFEKVLFLVFSVVAIRVMPRKDARFVSSRHLLKQQKYGMSSFCSSFTNMLFCCLFYFFKIFCI